MWHSEYRALAAQALTWLVLITKQPVSDEALEILFVGALRKLSSQAPRPIGTFPPRLLLAEYHELETSILGRI